MRQGVSKITEAAIISRQTATPVPTAQPRAVGRARVSVHHKDGAVRLKDLHQAGAMKLLFPQGRPHPEAVMVNTAGGITGGDRFSVAAAALDNSRLTVTTQAAERAYRAQPDETGRMETRLEVAAGARLNWLPQETILFNGSRFARRLRVDLAADARFLMVEPVVFGRLAMGEALTSARFSDRVEIRRDGQSCAMTSPPPWTALPWPGAPAPWQRWSLPIPAPKAGWSRCARCCRAPAACRCWPRICWSCGCWQRMASTCAKPLFPFWTACCPMACRVPGDCDRETVSHEPDPP